MLDIKPIQERVERSAYMNSNSTLMWSRLNGPETKIIHDDRKALLDEVVRQRWVIAELEDYIGEEQSHS